MNVNTSLIRTLGRWAFATLTSAVTTFLGLYGDPFAFGQEAECSLRDVSAWQLQLNQPTEEASPEYIYRVTTDFLRKCPNRPEVRGAHARAAMAAVDDDDAARALKHFQQALPLQTLQSQFYYVAALLANGDERAAWDVRDEVVDNWARRMQRNRLVTLDKTDVRGGVIYRVIYNATDANTGSRIAFTAVPTGGGWPATVTLGSERQLNAFHRLRAGETAQPLRHIDLYRCTGRRLLARSTEELTIDEVTAAAERSLVAYLARPDVAYGEGKEIIPCLWPERLLPAPPRQ
ncbi:MAG: hypothetical protein AAGG45_04710 [Pseudomonadota bacterium]